MAPPHQRILLNVRGSLRKFARLTPVRDRSWTVVAYPHDFGTDIFEAVPVLRAAGELSLENLEPRKKLTSGRNVHLTIHPNQIHLKNEHGTREQKYLTPPFAPQKFSSSGFRLLCFITPPPSAALPALDQPESGGAVENSIFEWDSLVCPQLTLYEVNNTFDETKVAELFPRSKGHKTIRFESHLPLLLNLSEIETNSDIWLPTVGIFGSPKEERKKPISKQKLQEILRRNGLSYNLSKIPDDAIIRDYHLE